MSPDAWARALEAMGEHDASIVIAAILQRGEEIKSAGGYLRVLTAKARAGEFSLGPVLMALLRGKAAKAARQRRGGGVMALGAEDGESGRAFAPVRRRKNVAKTPLAVSISLRHSRRITRAFEGARP